MRQTIFPFLFGTRVRTHARTYVPYWAYTHTYVVRTYRYWKSRQVSRMASSSSSSSKRFVKRGASARELVVKARGLDADAVPFAKPSVNHYRISRAAIAEDVSPVMERSGVLLKKAPVGRKARFFVTRNHFLNYWDSKLDMICASKSPYGSINLLKVYRIAQKGQKITLSFPEDMQLKPVDVRAPTATVAKKWAKNMSTRRLHFENVLSLIHI